MLLDAPAHEARIAILQEIIAGHGSKYYYLDTFFLPNIAFDVVGLGLTYIVTPETAGRIFFASTLLLTPFGLLILNRVVTGKWSVVPFLSVLVLFNLVTILGFFSYSFGLALLPWALACRLKLEDGPVFLRSSLGAVLAVVLLFCHVFAFGIYAVMSTSFALTSLAKRKAGLSRTLGWALETVPAGVLYLCMSTGEGSQASYSHPLLRSKLIGIAKAFTSGSLAADVSFLVGGASVLIILVFCFRARVVQSFRPGLIILVALYFLLPANLASGSYVDARMPIAIALLLFAGLDCEPKRSWATEGLIISAGGAFVAKQTAIALLWTSFSSEVGGIVRTLESLPANSIVMQTECSPDANSIPAMYRSRQPAMQHIVALSALHDLRFVPSVYAISGQQPIGVNFAFRAYYRLQSEFAPSCDQSEYKFRLSRIEALATAQRVAGYSVPPLYFFLIRPIERKIDWPADLVASGPSFALYRVAS
ncbi:MAG: hypothetical protein ABIP64_06210 [Burkholderiales bacterium]